MSTRRSILVGGIAAASIALIALAPTGSAASRPDSAGSLSVVSTSQHISPANMAVRVPVVVRSPDAGLFCQGVHIVATYWSGSGVHHQVAVDRPSGALESATLMIPAKNVRSGMLRYVVVATQGCGLFDASTHYYGRAPLTGSYAVRVLPGT